MPRRKDIGVSRRRVRDEDEAEVEGGNHVVVAAGDDSASDDSGFTDDEFDDNESEATYSDDDAGNAQDASSSTGKRAGLNGEAKAGTAASVDPVTADMYAMRNGISRTGELEAVDFEDMADQDESSGSRTAGGRLSESGTGRKSSERRSRAARRAAAERTRSADSTPLSRTPVNEPPLERKRREAEEYKKKREQDPAFVPNRGAFFMHDHRSSSGGANGFRPFGRGKGRNGFNGFASSPDAGGAWKHDMHDEIVAQEREREKQRSQRQAEAKAAAPASEAAPYHQPSNSTSTTHHAPHNSYSQKALSNTPPNRFFDTTVNKGNVQIRVSLPGMTEPKLFNEFAIKIYTKLPYHRPPLRRDKPVRISLPEASPRYIYPAISRSFVFIPRAMRPGGSGFTRGGIVGGGLGPTPRRGSLAGSYRGNMQTGSVYGGTSTHAPSVTMSRRSSIHQDFGRPSISFGNIPANSIVPSPAVTMRPIVRLPAYPPALPTHMDPGHQPHMENTAKMLPHDVPPFVPAAEVQPYEHKTTNQESTLTMHQPKPQKTVSVENIDNPTYNFANTNYPTPGPYSDGIPTPGYYNQHHHGRAPSYPSQPSTTPHSQLPDQAIHARPFHPAYANGYFYPMPPHAVYPPAMHAQPPIAHQPQGPPPPYVPSPVAMPSYVQQNQMAGPPAMQAPPQQPGPMGTIAQESNGMVYYYQPTQVYPEGYPQYMAPVPMGPPPSGPQAENQVPGAIHVNGMYYYPPVMPVPMVPQGPVYYG